MFSPAQAKALEAASVNKLGYIDRLNKPSYFFDDRDGGSKFNGASMKALRPYIVRVEYTPIVWLYGLNHEGKIAYAEYLKLVEKGKVDAPNNDPVSRGGQFDDDTIRAIRVSKMTRKDLAEKYGCSTALIGNIINGKLYKNVK